MNNQYEEFQRILAELKRQTRDPNNKDNLDFFKDIFHL